MKFPNAAKGVKRIFTAEILALLASVFLTVGLLLIVIGAASATDDGNLLSLTGFGGAAIFLIAFFVLVVIAFIMNLIGLINASHDESGYKSALVCLLISVVLMVTAGALVNVSPMVTNVLYSISHLFDIFITIFVIAGTVKLADRLNRGDVGRKGTNVLKLLLAVGVLSFIAIFISAFIGNAVTSVTAGILLLAASVLDVVKYFMYLSFLSQAKKMLAKS